MKIFKRLSQLSSVAFAGLLYISAAQGAVAAQAPKPLVQASSHSSIEQAYYYYHNKRYPYRYHGAYYNHRRYSGGHWHYY
jgi:hypothetical protein